MSIVSRFAANWQKFLPALVAIGIAAWIALFRNDPTSEQALFAGVLVIYFIHQIWEHSVGPGGFRQFTDAPMFHSGDDNWPVNIDGFALVNTAYVWLPMALAAIFPQTLRWVGLAWIGLTLINGITHIVTTIRLRLYNPGLVTSIVLFLPFTIFALALGVERGALTGGDVGLIMLYGVLLHLSIAALFEYLPAPAPPKSTVDNLPVLEKDTVYWDAGLPGFGVKVTPKGRKVFLVLYRLAGAGSRLRKYTIGPYGRVTLPMAKAQAQKIFAARLDGRDPAEEKKPRRRLVVDRVDDLVETFIREHVDKIGTSRKIAGLLRRDVIPYWGAKSIHEIKKRDVSDLISLNSAAQCSRQPQAAQDVKDLFSVVRGARGHRFFARRRNFVIL